MKREINLKLDRTYYICKPFDILFEHEIKANNLISTHTYLISIGKDDKTKIEVIADITNNTSVVMNT